MARLHRQRGVKFCVCHFLVSAYGLLPLADFNQYAFPVVNYTMSITAFHDSYESFQHVIETEGGLGIPLNLQLVSEIRAGLGAIPSNFTAGHTPHRDTLHGAEMSVVVNLETNV